MHSVTGALSKKNFVVLGCGGFIGSHLLDRLLDDETVTIVGFDPDSHKIEQHIGNPRFEFHQRYLEEPGSREILEQAIMKADAVVNLAAICNPSMYNTQPLATIKSNFIDAYPVADLCAKHGTWLIHYSTSEIYGRTISSLVHDDNYDNPEFYEIEEDSTPQVMGPTHASRWCYAVAKQLMERYAHALHQEKGMPYTLIRPFNFFGPRMDFIPGRDGEGVPRVLACFITALIDSEPMKLVDGGQSRRTIVSIHDAIEALVGILYNPEKGQNQIFNVGNRDNEVTIEELALLMRRIYAEVSGDPRFHQHPIEVVSSLEFYGEGYEDSDRRMPRLDKLKDLLDWEPKISLEDTLRETITYYFDLYGRDALMARTVQVAE